MGENHVYFPTWNTILYILHGSNVYILIYLNLKVKTGIYKLETFYNIYNIYTVYSYTVYTVCQQLR